MASPQVQESPVGDRPNDRLPRLTAAAVLVFGIGAIVLGVATREPVTPTTTSVETADAQSAGALAPSATTGSNAGAQPTSPAPPTAVATTEPAATTALPTQVPATPVPPTPVPETPTPVPTIERAWPAPMPTAEIGTFDPRSVAAGEVVLAVGDGVRIQLPRELTMNHGPEHASIYFDPEYRTEVDIFSAYAMAENVIFFDFQEAVGYVNSNAQFAGLVASTDVTEVNGHRAALFKGSATELDLGFHTSESSLYRTDAGWFMPTDVWLWIVDAPSGLVAITAEGRSVASGNEFLAAVEFAEQLVMTMEFR